MKCLPPRFLWFPCLVPIQLAPEVFAARMGEELGLPKSFVQSIATSISRQLARMEFEGELPEWMKESQVAPVVENFCRVDIDIRFRSVIYRDHLQWDINCPTNSPEMFARCTVSDLALPQVCIVISSGREK